MASFTVSNYNVTQIDVPHYTVQVTGLNVANNYSGSLDTFDVTGVAKGLVIDYPNQSGYTATAGVAGRGQCVPRFGLPRSRFRWWTSMASPCILPNPFPLL